MSGSTRIALFLLIVASSAACAKGPSAKLQGKWVGDHIDNVAIDQVARATGWVRELSFDIRGDNLTVAIPAEAPRSGTFEVASAEGRELTLSISGAGRKDEAKLRFDDDEKRLHWDIGDGRDVVLVRTP